MRKSDFCGFSYFTIEFRHRCIDVETGEERDSLLGMKRKIEDIWKQWRYLPEWAASDPQCLTEFTKPFSFLESPGLTVCTSGLVSPSGE